MKLVDRIPATHNTPETFYILSETGTTYRVNAPYEIAGLFKRDWSAYRNGRGAQFVTHTKPGQAAIEFAKALQN